MKIRIEHFALVATLVALPWAVAGCGETVEAAPPVKLEVPKQPIFDSRENVTKGVELPGVWRMVSAVSGELVTVQSVTTTIKDKVEVKRYGVPETMRLAGIVTPALGQPGFDSSRKKVTEWLSGKEDLTIEQDGKWPVDLENHRMVQIYFHPKSKGRENENWNLNRMLVHTGYAVVDIVSATSIDLQKLLYDEEFAKQFVDPKNPTIQVLDPITRTMISKPNVKPLGLWGLGIQIAQRESVSGPPGVPAPVNGIIPGTTTTISSTRSGATSIGNAPIRGLTPTPAPVSTTNTATTRTTTSARMAPTSAAPRTNEKSVGMIDGKIAYMGPKGGKYYYEANGSKRYFSQDQ